VHWVSSWRPGSNVRAYAPSGACASCARAGIWALVAPGVVRYAISYLVVNQLFTCNSASNGNLVSIPVKVDFSPPVVEAAAAVLRSVAKMGLPVAGREVAREIIRCRVVKSGETCKVRC
jgi:hypothetical protein